MSRRASMFAIATIAMGLLSCLYALQERISSGAGLYIVVFVLTMAASTYKVVLPRLKANLSLNYVCLIWGIARLSLAETMLLGIGSVFVQCYWRCQQRPKPIQIVFNASAICLAVLGGHFVFSSEFCRLWLPGETVRVLATAIAYYLINTGIVSTIVALTGAGTPYQVWRSTYSWAFPHYVFGASLAVAALWIERSWGIEGLVLILPAVYLVYQTFSLQIDNLVKAVERAELERTHATETAELHLRTIRALALAIEAKDQTTGEHLHRVQVYALGLGEEFGLPPDAMEALRAAAILHDIGKIAVPEHIISKPAKLSLDEFAKMKIHPIVGAEIVESVRFPFAVAPLVRAHHEKWDGTGYPDGLKGEEIPLGARILTAVDYFDALASDRQYRKAMPLEKAMAIIVSESGKALDPMVVEALQRRHVELEERAKKTLDRAPAGIHTDITVVRGKAPDAGYAIDTGMQCEQLRKRILAEFAVIDEARNMLAQPGELKDCVRRMLRSLRRCVRFDAAALFVCEGNDLECLLAEGERAAPFGGLRIPLGVGVSGWVASAGRPLINGNAQTEFGVSAKLPEGFQLVSGLAIPLHSATGVQGVITLYSVQRDAFTTDHLRQILAVESGLSYRLWLERSGLNRSESQAPREVAGQLAALSDGLGEHGAANSIVGMEKG